MSRDTGGTTLADRRSVLAAVGAGGALSLAGVGSAGDGPPMTPRTVHDVRMQMGPSTHPDRPLDFFYQPTGLHVTPGDVVRFVAATPDHTVVSYHPAFGMRRRVPAGVEPFSAPILGWKPDSLPDATEPPTLGMDGGNATGSGNATAGNVTGNSTAENATGSGANATTGEDGGAGGPVPQSWLYAFDEPGVYDIECAPHEHWGMAMRIVVGDDANPDFEVRDRDALPEPRAGPLGLARRTLTDIALRPGNVVEREQIEWQDLEYVEAQGGGSEP
jgi:plastocyanin